MIAGTVAAGASMVAAIGSMYQVAGDMNAWMDRHIREMQQSDNQTVSCTGRVLEGAKFGFGVGYIAPVTALTVGQLLLGNPLAAAGIAITAATLTNPFAMTCAAVGAIYYGWGALSDVERNDLLAKASVGLEIGIELIKSVVNYVIDGLKELLSAKNLAEIKEYVRKAAAACGKKMGDITQAVADRVSDAAQSAIAMTSSVVDATANGVKRASKSAADTASRAKDSVKNALDRNGDGQIGWDDLPRLGLSRSQSSDDSKDDGGK